MKALYQLGLWVLFLSLSACGVKSPPLPPLAETPQKSDTDKKTNASKNKKTTQKTPTSE